MNSGICWVDFMNQQQAKKRKKHAKKRAVFKIQLVGHQKQLVGQQLLVGHQTVALIFKVAQLPWCQICRWRDDEAQQWRRRHPRPGLYFSGHSKSTSYAKGSEPGVDIQVSKVRNP